ncbi:unnamed protein product [Polarella glacialis]|uniref:RRM domain-containing protein n=1 Tax=Polarella glacialis TaxID=89957 RepID=A0A813EV09_POLGL|nr:unnamed protein product [Polarella glacialis]
MGYGGMNGKGQQGGKSWTPVWNPMFMNPWMMGKGMGKGMMSKGKDTGLRSFPNEKKVWVGGLPANAASTDLNKKLQAHMKQAGACLFAEVGKSGIGGAAFKTTEEKDQAIALLNGSVFEGVMIQVDHWTKKEA